MSVFFELMDWSSGNVIKDYETEDAALEELRIVARDYGFDEIRGLALLRFQDGHPTLIAMKEELVARLNVDDQTEVAPAGTGGAHHAPDGLGRHPSRSRSLPS